MISNSQHSGKRKVEELKIPRLLPAFVQVKPDVFRTCEKATAADWRRFKALAKGQPGAPRSAINRMLRLADILGLSEDVPLYP
jgi:hypothetical protein